MEKQPNRLRSMAKATALALTVALPLTATAKEVSAAVGQVIYQGTEYSSQAACANAVHDKYKDSYVGKFTAGKKYAKHFANSACKWDVSIGLLAAVVSRESSFDPNVRGKAGEIGLGQLKSGEGEAGEECGLKKERDFLDPAKNINATGCYLRKQLNANSGVYYKALAAYNGGPGNMARGTTTDQAWNYATDVLEVRYTEFLKNAIAAKGSEQIQMAAGEAKEEKPAPRPKIQARDWRWKGTFEDIISPDWMAVYEEMGAKYNVYPGLLAAAHTKENFKKRADVEKAAQSMDRLLQANSGEYGTTLLEYFGTEHSQAIDYFTGWLDAQLAPPPLKNPEKVYQEVGNKYLDFSPSFPELLKAIGETGRFHTRQDVEDAATVISFELSEKQGGYAAALATYLGNYDPVAGILNRFGDLIEKQKSAPATEAKKGKNKK